MHSAALHLAPILAEKSKTPFYVAGAVLVVWALLISLGVGMRRPDFPVNLAQQRAVMAVTVLLVLFAISAAVLTAGGERKPARAEGPAAGQPSATPPTATTGTPAPSSSPAGSSTSLKLAANPGGELAFDAKTLAAKAGTVTITFENASPVEHDVTVAQGSTVLGHTPTFVGGTKKLTLNLRAGSYAFYCSVPGHRQAGMEGTLTVS